MLARNELNLIVILIQHPSIKQPMFLNGKIAPIIAINTDITK
ncbi:hypothetical protein AAULR_15579 [Lacticaseibacillus rhamnosus MTCC 5462]|nr:hypothetical protein AAULR_15579 [Lacticaseibacillus rhamnosus MTCC 5462]